MTTWEEAYQHHLLQNPALNHELVGRISSASPQGIYAGLRDRWHLGTLNVSPQHQRKGAGAMLVAWGLERCMEEGAKLNLPSLPAVLHASPSGQRLYAKMGSRLLRGIGWNLG